MDRQLMRIARAASVAGAALILCLAAACGTGKGPPAPAAGPSAPPAAGPADNAGRVPSAAGPAAAGVFPQRAGLAIEPENPDVLTGVRAVLTGFPIATKAEIVKVRWIVNGNALGGDETRLSGGLLRKGDVVTAQAEVRAGGETRVLAAAGVTVRNVLPEITAAALSPLAPRVGDTVRVEVTARDPDGDPVTYGIRWFVNDNEVAGEASSELPLRRAGVRKGAWIHAEVTARDDSGRGARMLTPKILVVNSPPVVSRVVVSPGGGNRFTATVQVSDPDGDPVSIVPKTLPKGVTLAGNALSWDASAVPVGEELPVVLLISDGDGGDIEYAFRLSASVSR